MRGCSLIISTILSGADQEAKRIRCKRSNAYGPDMKRIQPRNNMVASLGESILNALALDTRTSIHF